MVNSWSIALFNYHNIVNQGHPNANNPNKTRRRIQTLAGRGGKGRGWGRGGGRSGQEGRGRGSVNPNSCSNDKWQATGIDGNMIKVRLS